MKKLIFLAIILTGLTAGYFAFHKTPPPAQAAIPVPTLPDTFRTPPEIVPIYQRLGIPTDNIAHIYIELDNGLGLCSDVPGTLACYDGSIKYPRVLLSKPVVEQNEIFAHEYMHWVWTRKMTQTEQSQLISSQDYLYRHNASLYDRMGWFRQNNSKNMDSELHSVICTEMSDSELPPILRDHCAKWLPNRNALPSLF